MRSVIPVDDDVALTPQFGREEANEVSDVGRCAVKKRMLLFATTGL